MKSRNPNFQEYVKKRIERNEFMKHIGFKITEVSAGEICGELDFEKIHQQQNGYLHGGVTSTLCDIVSGFASYSLVEEGQQVFTVEAKVSYYNPGTGDKIFAKGRVEKAGKRFHFCESEIFVFLDGKKRTIAKGTATMAVI